VAHSESLSRAPPTHSPLLGYTTAADALFRVFALRGPPLHLARRLRLTHRYLSGGSVAFDKVRGQRPLERAELVVTCDKGCLGFAKEPKHRHVGGCVRLVQIREMGASTLPRRAAPVRICGAVARADVRVHRRAGGERVCAPLGEVAEEGDALIGEGGDVRLARQEEL